MLVTRRLRAYGLPYASARYIADDAIAYADMRDAAVTIDAMLMPC